MNPILRALTVRRLQSGQRRGFTLIEVMIVVIIVGMLAALAIPNFQRVLERARITKAIGDIKTMQQNITEFEFQNNRFPTNLAEVGMGAFEDSWGNTYKYLLITGKGKGGFRKDKFLVPINSDYDLYSMGPDGATSAPLGSKSGKDDIIRANDGGFVGVAENF